MLEDDSDQDSLKVSKTIVPLTINNSLISLNLLEDVSSSPTDLAILSEASTVLSVYKAMFDPWEWTVL